MRRSMMSRPLTVLAASAAMSVGSFAFCQAQPGQPDTGLRGTPATRSQSAAGQSAQGASQGVQGANQQGEAEQKMLQQLSQIAQDPNTACDKLFVLEAAKGNLKEQQLADQVAQKAQNPQVKTLAQQISKDHKDANQKLQPVAQQLGIEIPQSLPRGEQMKIQIMASLPADKLEKAYVAGMHADHARDVLKYQSVARSSENAGVKQYAQQVLPVLQQHHEQVMQTAQAIGVPADMEAVTAGAKISPSDQSGRSGPQSGQSGQQQPGAAQHDHQSGGQQPGDNKQSTDKADTFSR